MFGAVLKVAIDRGDGSARHLKLEQMHDFQLLLVSNRRFVNN